MKINLAPGEKVLAVVPEYCRGPGWRNTPIFIYIGNMQTGMFRSECIQPKDQTLQQISLFRVCEAANAAILDTLSVTTVARK